MYGVGLRCGRAPVGKLAFVMGEGSGGRGGASNKAMLEGSGLLKLEAAGVGGTLYWG